MKSIIAFFLAFLLFGLLPVLGNGSEHDRVKKHLADILYSEAREDMSDRLRDIGLSPQDIESTVNAVLDGYSDCLIEAMLESDDPLSREFYEKLATADSASEIEAQFEDVTDEEYGKWFGILAADLEFCRATVDQETGFSSQ